VDKVVVGAVDAVRVAESVSLTAKAHAHKQRGSVSMKFRYTEKDKPRVPLKGAGAVLGRADEKLHLTVDTREQKPLEFPSDWVSATRGTVSVFDYALTNDAGYSVERKSLPDFIQSVVMAKSWKRELKKIEKARERLLPIIYILEFSEDAIHSFDYTIFPSGRVTSQMVCRRIAELMFDHGVIVWPAGSRDSAAYWVCVILKRRLESLRQGNN